MMMKKNVCIWLASPCMPWSRSCPFWQRTSHHCVTAWRGAGEREYEDLFDKRRKCAHIGLLDSQALEAVEDARHAYEPCKVSRTSVVVQYCGEWGYAPRFEDLAGKIKKKFVRNLDRLVIIGKKDQDTSNFEVFVNNMFVHSKKTQNDGFVDTTLKEEKLFNVLTKH